MGDNVKWSISSYIAHNEAMREAETRLQTERDRRYAEVNVEKEKALKIKETADLTALELARESQVYKDERNDAMREQNLKETGVYATRDDLALVVTKLETALEPLTNYMTAQQGDRRKSQLTNGKIFGIIAATGAVVGIIMSLFNAFVV